MRSSSRSSARGALVAVIVLAAACSSAPSGGVTVTGAWARPTTGAGAPTAAYVTMTNTSGQADALVGVSSPNASMVEMHETSTDSSGMTGMHPISRIDIGAGATVALAPGALHLMIMGLSGPLAAGDTLELRLQFEHAGTIVVMAEVRQG